MAIGLHRRAFLGLVAAFSFGGLIGFWPNKKSRARAAAGAPTRGASVVVHRRSGRGRHVSNAAKKHNANRLYATYSAAASDPAHPGDKSRIVKATISAALFAALFGDGRTMVDLRRDLHTLSDYGNLADCLRGPGSIAGSSCTKSDLDGSGEVNLRDVSIFQRIFTGR